MLSADEHVRRQRTIVTAHARAVEQELNSIHQQRLRELTQHTHEQLVTLSREADEWKRRYELAWARVQPPHTTTAITTTTASSSSSSSTPKVRPVYDSGVCAQMRVANQALREHQRALRARFRSEKQRLQNEIAALVQTSTATTTMTMPTTPTTAPADESADWKHPTEVMKTGDDDDAEDVKQMDNERVSPRAPRPPSAPLSPDNTRLKFGSRATARSRYRHTRRPHEEHNAVKLEALRTECRIQHVRIQRARHRLSTLRYRIQLYGTTRADVQIEHDRAQSTIRSQLMHGAEQFDTAHDKIQQLTKQLHHLTALVSDHQFVYDTQRHVETKLDCQLHELQARFDTLVTDIHTLRTQPKQVETTTTTTTEPESSELERELATCWSQLDTVLQSLRTLAGNEYRHWLEAPYPLRTIWSPLPISTTMTTTATSAATPITPSSASTVTHVTVQPPTQVPLIGTTGWIHSVNPQHQNPILETCSMCHAPFAFEPTVHERVQHLWKSTIDPGRLAPFQPKILMSPLAGTRSITALSSFASGRIVNAVPILDTEHKAVLPGMTIHLSHDPQTHYRTVDRLSQSLLSDRTDFGAHSHATALALSACRSIHSTEPHPGQTIQLQVPDVLLRAQSDFHAGSSIEAGDGTTTNPAVSGWIDQWVDMSTGETVCNECRFRSTLRASAASATLASAQRFVPNTVARQIYQRYRIVPTAAPPSAPSIDPSSSSSSSAHLLSAHEQTHVDAPATSLSTTTASAVASTSTTAPVQGAGVAPVDPYRHERTRQLMYQLFDLLDIPYINPVKS